MLRFAVILREGSRINNLLAKCSYRILINAGAWCMQTRHLIRRRQLSKSRPDYAHFTVMMCCILLFLSSCSNVFNGVMSADVPQPTPTLPTASATLSPTGTRTDSNVESPLEAQLAKVQQIMTGMTLDQKLGQLIVVEYIGNNYAGTELQYMIAKQYVGGFLYQESNHNFEPPYNVTSNVADFSRQAISDAKIPLLIGCTCFMAICLLLRKWQQQATHKRLTARELWLLSGCYNWVSMQILLLLSMSTLSIHLSL